MVYITGKIGMCYVIGMNWSVPYLIKYQWYETLYHCPNWFHRKVMRNCIFGVINGMNWLWYETTSIVSSEGSFVKIAWFQSVNFCIFTRNLMVV